MTSLKIIGENRNLLLFPVLSSIALIFITLTFAGGTFAAYGMDPDRLLNALAGDNRVMLYALLFMLYLVNFFVMVFFNVGLVHCARLILSGHTTSIREGVEFSGSRVRTILSWSLLSATVGVILQILEDNLGGIGKLIVNIIGVVWSVATFFVVPVIAYEDVSPIQAVKRSSQMMKEKWGESIGANFSFGVFLILGYVGVIVLTILLLQLQPVLAIGLGVVAILLLHTVVAAAKTVFLAAAYNHMTDQPIGRFEERSLDSLFIVKG